MGKKNKKRDKYEAAAIRMRNGVGIADKGTRKAMERYGIDRSKYTNTGAKAQGREFGKATYEDMEKDILKAAQSDYDTRRAIEAAAMSGDKRAVDFANDGMGDFADVLSVQDMQRQQHKELGNGGDFSSASDFAGLSYGLAERDRENMTSSFDDKYATKSALDEMQTRIKQEAVNTPPPEPSAELTAAQEGVSSYDSGLGSFGTGIFGGDDVSQDGGTGEAAAQEYLDEYKRGLMLS